MTIFYTSVHTRIFLRIIFWVVLLTGVSVACISKLYFLLIITGCLLPFIALLAVLLVKGIAIDGDMLCVTYDLLGLKQLVFRKPLDSIQTLSLYGDGVRYAYLRIDYVATKLVENPYDEFQQKLFSNNPELPSYDMGEGFARELGKRQLIYLLADAIKKRGHEIYFSRYQVSPSSWMYSIHIDAQETLDYSRDTWMMD